MAELYRHFAKDWNDCLDFSDSSLIELYNQESYGGRVSHNNGFYHGKKWLNVTVKMWLEDIEKGLLFKSELYADDNYPDWWLDSIFKK